MALTATITKFGIQSGTEDTLYVAWSWPPSTSSSSGAGSSSSGSITYYKKPSYSGYSIVDALAKAGEKDTSLAHRKKIAVLNGYVSKESSWTGTSTQNGKMLKDLLAGKLIKSKSGSTTSSSTTTIPHTDHYRVVWQYKLDGIWYVISDEETKTKHSTATMTDNPYITEYRVRVLPVSKTYKKSGSDKEVSYWTASWTAWKSYKPPYRQPAQAPTPTLSSSPSSTSSNRQVVANVSGITDSLSKYIIFELFINEQKSKTAVAKSPRVKVGTGSATYTFKSLKASTNYVVRATASYSYSKTVNGVKKTYYTEGDPSGYSSVYSTSPAIQAAPKVTVERILEDASTAKLYVTWVKDTTARKYTIQATYDVTYFNNNDQSGIQSKEFIDVSSDSARLFEITLGGHTTWYFRVVVENALGEQATPMSTKYYTKLSLGVRPAAPTTWTMTSSFMNSEPMHFYWVHNSIDSSWQTSARIKLEFEDGGDPMVILVSTPASGRDPSLVTEPMYDKEVPISSEILSRLESGSTIRWSVQTRGAYGDGSSGDTGYSDWSVVRAIDVYAQPTMSLDVTDDAGNHIQETGSAHAYPITVTGSVTATGQEFIGYDVSITALEDYEILDGTGHEITVSEGTKILQQHYNVESGTTFTNQILPGDALLQNGTNYALTVVAAFDSGLTTEQTIEFYTDWDSIDTYIPTATISIDEDNICADITPMCMKLVYDAESELVVKTAEQTAESISYDRVHGYTTTITPSLPDRYILSESEPSDWSTTYMYYLTYDGTNYIPVPESETPPQWAANTYYTFEPDNQQFMISTDSDNVELKICEATDETLTFMKEVTSLYLGSSNQIEDVPEEYILTESEPSDWAENWSSYFTKTEYVTYEQVSMSDEAPEWEENTYYKLEGDEYVLTSDEPEDWSTNYFDYYTRSVEEAYETVQGLDEAPEWVSDTYYKYSPPETSNKYDAEIRLVFKSGSSVMKEATYSIGAYDTATTEVDMSAITEVCTALEVYLRFYSDEASTLAASYNVKFVGPYVESDPIAANVEMAIYRIEHDGKLRLIADSVINDGSTTIRDPHPPLDYARYRVVATDMDSGTISYSDITPEPVGYPNIVLQWDESWSSSNVDADVEGTAAANQFYSGERIILPYNIETSESNSLDVSLVDYSGRENPVSYYGTKTGETGSWNTVIPKTDTDTLYALRRLAVYRGDVYVREPSGVGYWASIAISMSNSYDSMIIPISISVTRVNGGI